MEILNLKLVITDEDLNSFAAKFFPKDVRIQEVRLKSAADGIHISGKYRQYFAIGFSTRWRAEICRGKVRIKLVSARAMGIPVTVFRSLFFQEFKELVQREEWLSVTEDGFQLDVDQFCSKEGISFRSNLTGIQCETERIIVTAEAARD